MALVDRSSSLQWFDQGGLLLNSIDPAILSITASYSMDMCAQLTVQVHDPNFYLAKSNYFFPTRDVIYESFAIQEFGANEPQSIADASIKRIRQRFEIAVAEVSPGPGSSAIWNIELRTKAIQQMKRDREPGAIKGNGSDYARQAAEKYGLLYFMENTSKGKQITKASSNNRADSTWDVLTRLASDAKFVIFEMNGYLVFCSQKFLLGKWGSDTVRMYADNPIAPVPIVGTSSSANATIQEYKCIPINWPSSANSTIQLVEMPSMRMSENDPLEATGSLSVDRANGTSLRPGMTVYLTGIPTFEKLYLISSVTYDHFGTDPVKVEIRTPEREEKHIRDYVVGFIPQDSVIGWSPTSFLPPPEERVTPNG